MSIGKRIINFVVLPGVSIYLIYVLGGIIIDIDKSRGAGDNFAVGFGVLLTVIVSRLFLHAFIRSPNIVLDSVSETEINLSVIMKSWLMNWVDCKCSFELISQENAADGEVLLKFDIPKVKTGHKMTFKLPLNSEKRGKVTGERILVFYASGVDEFTGIRVCGQYEFKKEALNNISSDKNLQAEVEKP